MDPFSTVLGSVIVPQQPRWLQRLLHFIGRDDLGESRVQIARWPADTCEVYSSADTSAKKEGETLSDFDKEREAALMLPEPERSRALAEAADRWRAHMNIASVVQTSATPPPNAVVPGTDTPSQQTSASGRCPASISS